MVKITKKFCLFCSLSLSLQSFALSLFHSPSLSPFIQHDVCISVNKKSCCIFPDYKLNQTLYWQRPMVMSLNMPRIIRKDFSIYWSLWRWSYLHIHDFSVCMKLCRILVYPTQFYAKTKEIMLHATRFLC